MEKRNGTRVLYVTAAVVIAMREEKDNESENKFTCKHSLLSTPARVRGVSQRLATT